MRGAPPGNGAHLWIRKGGRGRLAVVRTPLISVTKEVNDMELLGGVEDTESVDEGDEGGGVEDGEVERGVEGKTVVGEEKKLDVEVKVLGSKVDVGVGVADVKENVERSWVVVGVLVLNVMIVTASNDLRTPEHAPRIERESCALRCKSGELS